MPNYGVVNAALTSAIKRIAATTPENIYFGVGHLELRKEERDFDHVEIMTCLKKGSAHGPEVYGTQLRTNVVHRGLHIRVVIGGLDDVQEDWAKLTQIVVISVMEAK